MELSSQEMELLRQYRGATQEGQLLARQFLENTTRRSRGQVNTSYRADCMNATQGVMKA
ncbi:hypothetical protein OBV_24090 [Oscillibacter valericigenes Sjm18-20]|nr:hypothetical protein OBV_24090 [Oscillibacter valericigenes Sjm18-20]